MAIEFVELDAARAARGVRLVLLGMVPSPWSEAAKGIFHVKGIDVVATRFRIGDDAVKAWTGIHNAPVVMFDDEPPRSHWADILGTSLRRCPRPERGAWRWSTSWPRLRGRAGAAAAGTWWATP